MKKWLGKVIPLITLGMFLVGCGEQEVSSEVVYIATLNGTPLPLDQYYIYLREEIARFELIGGADIWQTTMSGLPTLEVAKNNALEGMVRVVLTNKQSETTLLPEQIDQAQTQAQQFWDTLPTYEQLLIPMDAIAATMEALWLQQVIEAELTQNYHPQERAYVFNRMFESWRAEAQVIRHAQTWDNVAEGFMTRGE